MPDLPNLTYQKGASLAHRPRMRAGRDPGDPMGSENNIDRQRSGTMKPGLLQKLP